MGERRSFSRSPRKALSREARQRLIAEMLDEELEDQGVAVTTISSSESAEADDTFSSSLDALDALDAQPLALEDELRDPEAEEEERESQLPESDVEPEAPEAFDALLTVFDSDEEANDEDEDGDELRHDAEEIPARSEPLEQAPLRLTDAYQSAPNADAMEVSDPLLQRSAEETAQQERLRAAYEAEAPALHREPADKWDSLDVMPVDVDHLEQNLVITASRNEPAHGAFDVLRTRLVQTLLEHNWKRVAITSPTRNCGKTFTSVNLAISLSRYEATRTILMDFDMRNPSVASVIGDTQPGRMGDFLRGTVSAEELLVRFDKNALNIGAGLAIGTNHVVEPYASELAHEPTTRASLDRMMEEMSPDIVLFDMPPALAFDDVIAFRQHFDGVLMVVSGGETSPEDVREVMRRMGEETPLLGVVLNQAEGEDGSDYSYGN